MCRLGLLAHPASLDGRLVLGAALLQLGRFDEVLGEMRVALEHEPSSAEARALKGEALLRKGDHAQASVVLAEAASLAPHSTSIRKLADEAELAAGHGFRGEEMTDISDVGGAFTQRYPTHQGVESDRGGVTRPSKALGNRHLPSPSAAVLAIGDTSGTVELDPELEGVELRESIHDPLAPPPGGTHRLGPEDLHTLDSGEFESSDIVELDSSELLEESVSQALPMAAMPRAGARSLADEPTAFLKKRAAPVASGGASRASAGGTIDPSGSRSVDPLGAPPPGDFAASTSVGTVPEGARRVIQRGDEPTVVGGAAVSPSTTSPSHRGGAARGVPLPAPPKSAPIVAAVAPPPEGMAYQAPAIDDLFPEDDDGGLASLVAIAAPVQGQGRGVGDAAAGNPASPMAAARVPAPAADMDMIRRGLGLGAGMGAATAPTTPAHPVGRARPKPNSVAPPASGHARVMPAIMAEPRSIDPAQVVSAHPQRSKHKRKRNKAVWFVYAIIALAVVGGGIYAGLEIRKMRLERQVAGAQRDAQRAAATDTYAGYQQAREAYLRIAAARNEPRANAAVARIEAALAAEFGDDTAAATAALAALPSDASAPLDASLARIYLELANEDLDAARLQIETLTKAGATDPLLGYLAGRIEFAEEHFDAAEEILQDAARRDARPLVFVALGRTLAAKKQYPEALEAFDRALTDSPNMPWAVIHRSRALVAQGTLPSVVDGDEALAQIIAGGARASEGAARISQLEVQWATLALAEVAGLRGDEKGASAAAASLATMESGSLEFVEAAIAVHLSRGDLKRAGAGAEAAVKRWPKRLAARVVLAEVALAANEPAKAVSVLDDAGDLSKSPVALAARGRARVALGETDAAESDLESALALAPDLRTAIVARAELDLRRSDPQAALARLEPLGEPGEDEHLALVLAAAYRGAGDRKRSRELINKLVESPSLAGRAHLELARLERDESNFRAARAAYGKAIELLDDAVDARIEAALLAFDTGDVPGAHEVFTALTKDASDNGRVLVEGARFATMTGALDDAAKLLDAAEAEPSAPKWQIARERGRYLLRARRTNEAIAEFERSIGIKGDDDETRLLLIDGYLAAEDGTAARRALTDILKRFAGRPTANLAIGRVDLYFDRLKEAGEAFLRAEEQLTAERASPRLRADVSYWLARTKYYGDQISAARAYAKKATELNPASATAFYMLGLIESDRKQYKLAVAAFAKVVAIAPDNAEAWFYLGDTAAKSRDKKRAKKAFEKYLELQPAGDLAEEAKAFLKRR